MSTDLALVLRAAVLAAEAHAGQTRKILADPYVNHPLRVAAAAQRCGLGPECIAAALLHDVVEDTACSLTDLARQFPPRVVELVDRLTKWWPDDASRTLKQAESPRYFAKLLADAEAVELKLLDRADNLNDMARMLPKAASWARRYLTKTELEFEQVVAHSRNEAVQALYKAAVSRLKASLEGLPEWGQ